jgi:hypothetical protein
MVSGKNSKARGWAMSVSIDDEPVKLLLSGIFKSGKTVFFKIDSNGKHEKVNVSLALRTLNMSHGAISRLIAAFDWPKLKYYSDAMRRADEARGKPSGRISRPKPVAVDEPEDEEAEEEVEELSAAKNDKANKHFYIIQQGEYFGVYNALEATVDLYRTRTEAQEHLQEILHGRDGYHISYGGMGNRSRSHAAADIHY